MNQYNSSTVRKLLNLFVIVSQPIAMVLTFEDRPRNYTIWLSVAFLFFTFIALNYFFVKEVREFVSKTHNVKEVYSEFSAIFLTGISNILLFATLYYIFGISSDTGIIKNDFYTSIYFSIVTWTTLGYGDLSPILELRLIAALEALLGYIYMTILIGMFLSMIRIKVTNINFD